MPVTIEIADDAATEKDIERIFSYFEYVDGKFSTYKEESEISRINKKEIVENEWSADIKEIFDLSEKTKAETGGYFDITGADGRRDPSGLVKGWAIWQAARMLESSGFENFYVNAGGDIQVRGKNGAGEDWKVGIRNPFDKDQIIKVLRLKTEGLATSGTYERGEHIYNPLDDWKPANKIVSLSVIGPNVYEADRFATAAFAMGAGGIGFIERLPGLEGYMVDKNGTATMTSGFQKYISHV